jgi:hypothetical protein
VLLLHTYVVQGNIVMILFSLYKNWLQLVTLKHSILIIQKSPTTLIYTTPQVWPSFWNNVYIPGLHSIISTHVLLLLCYLFGWLCLLGSIPRYNGFFLIWLDISFIMQLTCYTDLYFLFFNILSREHSGLSIFVKLCISLYTSVPVHIELPIGNIHLNVILHHALFIKYVYSSGAF